jgi:6-phosphogluconolactonase
VWFLVSGEGKAEAFASAIAGADKHDIPATGVTGMAETLWLIDHAAAGQA